MDRHIIKIEDFVDYTYETIIASDPHDQDKKRIVQKTFLQEVSRGRFELTNVLYVKRLGKIVASTNHIVLAIAAYNKL